MTRKKNVPGLRFSGFEGEWEEKKLGAVIELVSGQHLNPDEYNLEERGVPYFTGPSDFTNSLIGVTKWTVKNGKSAFSNDILFTVKGSGVGTMMFLQLSEVVMGRQLMAIRAKGSIDRFLYQHLSTKGLHFESLARGNMIPGISRQDIIQSKIYLPTLPEQQKIAAFLTAVDTRIQQLTRKKALLEQYKKGVMQQIFSRQLRFRDEAGKEFGEWEVKRLGEIGSFKNGLNKSKEDFGFGYPFVNLMDVFGKSTISNDNFDLVNANVQELEQYSLKEGDILFIRSSVKREGVGEVSVVLKDIKNTVYSGFLIRFREKEGTFNLLFKKFCFAAKSIRNQILSLSTTSANTNINQESLASIEIPIPTLPEQQKIATFLSALDTRINHVAAQITYTQTYKKGLLQQMFV